MSRTVTGLGPEREARAQVAILRRLENVHARPLSAEIARASNQMIAAYIATRAFPSLPLDHAPRMRAIYAEMTEATIRTFGARIIDQGKAASPDLERKSWETFAAFFQQLALDWIASEAIRRRISMVSETTRQRIIDAIERGQREGLGVEAIAQGIRDQLPVKSMERARIIARTETHGAANYASIKSAQASGMQLEKEWVSVEDMRTRSFLHEDAFDHASMNGQRAPMDQAFMMPNIYGPPLPIMYPGEAGMPGGAVINCRCAVVYHIKGGLLGD